MFLSIMFSLAGCILTALQIVLILYRGDGICFNEGCAIVDNLTLVPPLYFNLAGFLFFLLISFSLKQARNDSEIWQRFASLLLLAGLAAEGVLFSFQFFITEIFCSYCLIILSLVVLASIFMGLKQIFKSIVIFSAVTVAFASLDFKSGSQPAEFPIDNGSIGKVKFETSEHQLYLFFSSTCSHCEDVIEEMKLNLTCSVNFNPVDPIESFTFPNAQITSEYSPQLNINYLRNLGINGVPVLVDMHGETTTIIKGGRAISTFLELTCSAKSANQVEPELLKETSSSSPALPVQDEDCSISEDCDSQSTVPINFNQQTMVQ